MEQNCLGERYIGCGARAQTFELDGTPGNALGAYLDGAEIIVRGNAQDATGDTMNAGNIIIHGSTGDAAGYAMRGGSIYVREGAGYRAGIHMKAYKEKLPVIVIGGSAGSFLGEYQAGGVIVVFALDGGSPVGSFCATGMHGGKIILRCASIPSGISEKVLVNEASEADKAEIRAYAEKYCAYFPEKGISADTIMNAGFYILTPDTKNPYRQMYVYN